jgi:hypothetical protein
MNTSGFLFQPRLHLSSSRVEEVPVIRIWSSQPEVHPDWHVVEHDPLDSVHCLALMFTTEVPEELHRAQSALKHINPMHCISLPDAQPTTWLAMRDVVHALQCDGVHSVMANADLEDLIQVLGNQSTVQVNTSFASSLPEAAVALQSCCQQSLHEQSSGLVVIRAHAKQDFQQMGTWLETIRAQLPSSGCFMYWDIYDPDLQPGQKRFTCLWACTA